MNSIDHPPRTDSPAPDQQVTKQAATALSQIISGFEILLRIAGRTIVRLAAGCFGFTAARLDTFTTREFGAQGVTQRALSASQKPARVGLHYIKRWKLTELETAPVFVRAAVVCITVLIAYGLFDAVFSSAPPARVVRMAVARDVGPRAILSDGSEHKLQHNELWGPPNKLKSFKITNHYNRTINGEKFHVYDYAAQLTKYGDSCTVYGTVHLVKRGSEWYDPK
jgi:hypothetical protein